ncbi:chromosomal protein D1-like [Drosophila sulfurigaster albostrigata]|uniref:chromosomal protein D1-like n=1 Tax=Drosophila sulfurigaster albostrigata TaxID=89887 RepID=UPI002D21A784|nr:chromosomal protein D1-like [Drosophila sulfurigaster albostrigata]
MEAIKKRGRPSTGPKTPKTPSGNGRGRPKKIEDPTSAKKDKKTPVKVVLPTPKKAAPKPKEVAGSPGKKALENAEEPVRHLGRPSKKKPYSYVPTGRPLGRPPSGNPTTKLTIIRTGRKPGRPKAKRGPYVPTGRPRGRPKVNQLVVDDSEEVDEEPGTPKKRGRQQLADNIKSPSPSKLIKLF